MIANQLSLKILRDNPSEASVIVHPHDVNVTGSRALRDSRREIESRPYPSF